MRERHIGNIVVTCSTIHKLGMFCPPQPGLCRLQHAQPTPSRSWLLPLTPRVCLLLVLYFLLVTSASHQAAGACASCLNGGKLLMPNNIFGFCRCKCADSYQGPRCQFGRKKRGHPLSPLSLGWGSQLLGSREEEDREELLGNSEALLEALWDQLYQLDGSSEKENVKRRR